MACFKKRIGAKILTAFFVVIIIKYVFKIPLIKKLTIKTAIINFKINFLLSLKSFGKEANHILTQLKHY